MSRLFEVVAKESVKSSRFNLSHDHKTSFFMGHLIPGLVQEVLPGDKFTIGTEAVFRVAPVVAPVMHKCRISLHHWFVANRNLWSGWEDFISGNADVVPPFLNKVEGINNASLGQYMGIPNDVPGNINLNALPVAAYFNIFDEWYRDQNLVAETFIPLVDGDNTSNYSQKIAGPPLYRAWNHDYFTSCLPFAQKGDPVTLPLLNNDDAVVQLEDPINSANQPQIRDFNGNLVNGATLGSHPVDGELVDTSQSNLAVWFDPNSSLVVPINSEASTITTLRRAYALQEFLELSARVGTRYREVIMANFGVKSSDARLDVPEFIGGTTDHVVFSEVLQTNQFIDFDEGNVDTPLGFQGGHGIGISGGRSFDYFAEEHGFIITMVNIQPDTAYQDGLDRMWSREDRFDYFWRHFEHIGEQAVLNKEVRAAHADPDGTFGYIPRYAEYKFRKNMISGDFRDNMDYYHFGRKFNTDPALNADFVTCVPPDRPFATWDLPEGSSAFHVYAHIYFHINAQRRMSKFGNPGM